MSCIVYGCSNNSTGNPDPSVHYYEFPKHPVIAQQWLDACGWNNSDHVIDTNSTRVCSIHFEESAYTTEVKVIDYMTCFTKTLKYDAVPTQYLPTQIIIKELEEADSVRQIIVYTVPSTQNDSNKEKLVIQGAPKETEPSTSADEPSKEEDLAKYQNIKTTEQLDTLIQKNKDMKNIIEDYEKGVTHMNKKLEDILALYKEKDLELDKLKQECSRANLNTTQDQKKILSKVFSDCQIKILCGKKKIYWTNDDMAVAFTIRHLSNKRCYVHLKKNLNIPLPAISSMKRWMTIQSRKNLQIRKSEDNE